MFLRTILEVSGPQIYEINNGYTLKKMRVDEDIHQSEHSDADAIEEAYDAIDQFEKRRLSQ